MERMGLKLYDNDLFATVYTRFKLNSIMSHHALSNRNNNTGITVIIKSSSLSTLCILL